MSEEREKPPVPRKISINERAEDEAEQETLSVLREWAGDIESRLFAAFGSAPSHKEIQDAPHQVVDELIELAKAARIFARQYRGFNVGAVVLGFRPTEHPGRNPWCVMFDANTKPTAADGKWCAEQYLMDRAESPAEVLDRILAFIVVAEPQTDDASKRKQITLTPCKLCRDRMLASAESSRPVVTLETDIITADARTTGIRKLLKVKDLPVFHGELPRGYFEID